MAVSRRRDGPGVGLGLAGGGRANSIQARLHVPEDARPTAEQHAGALLVTLVRGRRFARLARPARGIATAAFAVGFLAWVVLLRPTALGGSTTYVIVAGDSMLPTYRSGDLIVAQPAGLSGPGSVVVYRIPAGDPGAGRLIVHRIVADDAGTGFTTRGDHNVYTDPWHPTPADIVGAPVMTLPGVGNAIGFVRQPIVAAMVASVLTIAWLFHRRRAQPKGVDPASVGAHSREPSDVGYNPA
jgi:signal peptidase